MNEPKRRAARHSLTGTGLYIALFLGLTALAVAGYWMLLPSSTDKTPTKVTEPPVTTPITAEPVTPDVPEVKPEEPAEPVQSVVEVTVSEKEAEVTEPVTPVAPRLIVSPLSGETVAAFSMDELAYSETLADWRTHDGIDIKADAGTQVLAASSGTVLSVADDDLMGTTVVIAHDGGYETTYSNLQSVPTVAPEQYVSAGQVIGVEVVSQAIEDAQDNARRNGIENARFFCADAGKAALQLAAEGIRPDVITADPPRKGISQDVIDAIAAMNPDRVV